MTQEEWKEVFEHNQKLEDEQHPDTLLASAVLHGRGLGTVRNLERATYLLHKSARAGNGFAMKIMGWDSRYSRGAEGQVLDKAGHDRVMRNWFQRYAIEGVAAAQIEYGLLLLYHDGQVEEGLEMLRRAADQGHPAAMDIAGFYYTQPDENPRDIAQAKELIVRGADLGEPLCIVRLAWLLDKGISVPRDVEAGVELYNRAIALGEPWGAYHIGVIYQEGRGSKYPRDIEMADTYFKKCLELCKLEAFRDDPSNDHLEGLLADRGVQRERTTRFPEKVMREAIGFD